MILIRAGRVLGPAEGLDIKADVVLDGDRIAGIFPADQGGAEGAPGFSTRERQYEQIIEAEGLAAAPGLVDVHVHFRDPGPTYKEDIHTGARAAAKGGFTTVVCMANTNPIVDNEETLRYVLEEGKKTGIHVLSCAAVSKGFAGRELTDMEGLLAAGAAGFTDDGIPLMEGTLSGRPWRKRPDWIRFSASMRRTSILSGKMESTTAGFPMNWESTAHQPWQRIPWWPGTA